MGNAFTVEVSDTRELASVFLDTFGREYEKLHMWFLLQHVRRAMQRESQTSEITKTTTTEKIIDWKLYHAPQFPPQCNERDSVMAAKQSKHLKRWNPRYFVLRGDFLLDYYESRSDHVERRHPLGTINLGNININYNATQAAEGRMDKMATLCSLARSEVPAPAIFPEFTIELYHRRRGGVYLQFPIKERYEMWYHIFDRAHWLTARLFTNDSVHRRAFLEAFRRARVMCGLPDSLEFSGIETTILNDAITELVDLKVTPKFLQKLGTSSWKDRMAQLHILYEKSDELLKNFISGKWHVTQGKTCGRRVVTEAKVRDNMKDINAFEEPLREEVHKYTTSETVLFLTNKIENSLKELAIIIAPQIRSIYLTLPKLYEACVSQGKVHYESSEDHMFLATQYNSIGECYEAERELWRLREPIAAMKSKFNNRVYEWNIIQETVIRPLRRIIVNGAFTFETMFERNKMQRSWDDTLREVRGFVELDSRKLISYSLSMLLYETSLLFFRDEYVKPSLIRLKASMIVPLEARVPTELSSFIPSIQEIVEDVLMSDLREMCQSIADNAIKS